MKQLMNLIPKLLNADVGIIITAQHLTDYLGRWSPKKPFGLSKRPFYFLKTIALISLHANTVFNALSSGLHIILHNLVNHSIHSCTI